MLNCNDYTNIVNFSCDLGKVSHNFYENCLDLISKYFNYKHLMFVPEILNTKSKKDINKVYYLNFYSINIQDELIIDFKNSYYKDSLFQPLNLSQELLSKEVIVIEDLMPYEEFIHTKNAKFLNKYNYHYFLGIALLINEVRIGALCVLKSKDTGNFLKKDIEIAKIIGNIVSIQYNNFLKLSNCLFSNNILKECYNFSNNGIIIWDNNQEIIQFNNLAKKYCSTIAEKLNSSNNFLYSDLIVTDNSTAPIKKIINYLTLTHLKNTSKPYIEIKIDNFTYNMKVSTITIPEISGNIKTCNFAEIVKSMQSSNIQKNKLKDSFNLTDRELEIINLIRQGCSNNEISKSLYLSLNTVKTHISNIYKKLNINSRAALINKLDIILINTI